MVSMDHITPCKGSSLFSEETILFTPLPQATSTVTKRPDLLPQPEVVMEPDKKSPDIRNSYLSDGLSAINELRQKLDSLGLKSVSNPCTSGILNPDSVTSGKINSSSNSKTCPQNSSDVKNNKAIDTDKGLLLTSIAPSINQVMADITNLNRSLDHLPNSSMSNFKTTDINLPAFKDANVSLPTDYIKSATDVANLSLPVKSETLPSNLNRGLPSLICSSFNPLPGVSDEIKRNTFTLNTLGTDESKRSKAIEKALHVINSLDLVPFQDSSNNSAVSLQRKSLENMTFEQDVSGFSQLMNKSDFQKDESWCANNFGLPIKPGDKSLSFLSSSQVSLDFMPADDSLFIELGPADPPKFNHDLTQNSAINSSLLSEKNFSTLKLGDAKIDSLAHDGTVRDSSRDVKDLFSHLEDSAAVGSSFMMGSMTNEVRDKQGSSTMGVGARSTRDNFDSPRSEDSLDGVLRVSEIVKVLQDIPLDATPNSLAKKFMELDDKFTSSEDKSLTAFGKSEHCHYERTVVYGGIAHVELPSENATSQTLWNFVDLDFTQVKAIIKSEHSPIKVLMFPFVRRNILVKIQEVDFDRNGVYFTRLHKIKLIVENPQVEIVGATELDFGLIPESGSVTIPLTIRCKNSNVVVICPKFDHEELSPFKLILDEEVEDEFHLPPNQIVEAKVLLNPVTGFCADPQKIINIVDKLKLCLCPLLGSETLCQIPLKASIFLSNLRVQNIETPISTGEERMILFKNASPCPIKVSVSTRGQFRASISQLMLKSEEIVGVNVTFVPAQDKDSVEGELILSLVPGGLNYNIKLTGKINFSDTSYLSSGDMPSRSSSSLGSVNSSLNNSGEPEGSLQLECTSMYLVWPSIALGSLSTIKSSYVRSKRMCKEKLVIEINDSTNSFYLVTNERERKKSEAIVLNPQEKKQIAVEFSPKLLGQVTAQVLIKRAKSKDDSDWKQVILYGYGGCANLRAHNIVMDLESRQFTLSLQANLSQQFSLQNWGDGIAFYSLSQKKLEGMHLEVSPVRGLIGPGEVRTVMLTLQADSAGSQSALFHKLLSKDKSMDIVISSLSIMYGDESTRLRLARLFRKYKNHPPLKKSPQVTNPLKNLTELFPVTKQKMECVASLKDPLTSLSDLFDEGIQELSIDIIARRKTIEDASLDLTQQFVSFSDANQADETEYTTLFETTLPSHLTFH